MPRHFLALLIILLFCTNHAIGQADSILALPQSEQAIATCNYFIKHLRNSPERNKQCSALEAQFEQRHATHLTQIIWTLKQTQDLYDLADAGMEGKLAYFANKQAEAKSKKWTQAENEMNFRLGSIYFDYFQFGHGMELMMESHETSIKKGWSNVFAAQESLEYLGNAHYRFGDYASAISFLKEIKELSIPTTCLGYPYKSENSLGLCYEDSGKMDSAIYYLTLSHDHAAVQADSFWMALTSGNIGEVYLRMGEMDKAFSFIEEDYEGSLRAGQMGSAVNSSCLLANIELKRGNSKKAETYLQFAAAHIDTAHMENALIYYENLFEYRKQLGDDRKAVMYADTLSRIKARRAKWLDNHILDQAKMKVAIANYDSNIQLLQASRSRQVLLRNTLLVILVLGSIIVLLWIRRIQLKRESALQKLGHAQQELAMFTKSILEKNELIQTFRNEVEKLKIQGFEQSPERAEGIRELINTNILTEEDWKQFRQLFDIVYPGFLVRLREKFSDLTPAETRLFALVRLQLPAREMADMLGISPDSIYKTRYRLRKKLNLSEDGSLEELVGLI